MYTRVVCPCFNFNSKMLQYFFRTRSSKMWYIFNRIKNLDTVSHLVTICMGENICTQVIYFLDQSRIIPLYCILINYLKRLTLKKYLTCWRKSKYRKHETFDNKYILFLSSVRQNYFLIVTFQKSPLMNTLNWCWKYTLGQTLS